MKNGDIYVSAKNERGEWQRPEPVEGELNSDFDEGIVSFTPDGQTMYLTKARREPAANTGVEIYTSTRSDAKWSAPVKLEITADTLSSYGHPAVSPDGQWLYFTSDMPGGSGGKDDPSQQPTQQLSAVRAPIRCIERANRRQAQRQQSPLRLCNRRKPLHPHLRHAERQNDTIYNKK